MVIRMSKKREIESVLALEVSGAGGCCFLSRLVARRNSIRASMPSLVFKVKNPENDDTFC